MDLPEIEAVRRWLHEHAVGRPVRALHVRGFSSMGGEGGAAGRGAQAAWRAALHRSALDAAEVGAVERIGRHLFIQLGTQLLAMLPRTGGELYCGRVSRDVPAHWRVALELDALALWLCDPGSTARAVLEVGRDARTAEEALRKLDAQGLEPLSATFTLASFKKVLRGRRRSIFRLLVDGQLIAGIGVPYADEILYGARVKPTRLAPTLGDDELRAVYYSILEVLQKAVRFGGISDEQQPNVEGHPGVFQRHLAVHGRRGAPCPACQGRIRVVDVAACRAFYCPRCQH